jgi:acyl carrier protein
MVSDRTRPGPGHQDTGHGHRDDAFVLAGIADVARQHLQWTAPASRDLPLVEAFELDSLRQLTLLIELENRFRIRLDDRGETSILTVGDLVDVIRRKLRATHPADAGAQGSAR